jgi:PKD repeat protein
MMKKIYLLFSFLMGFYLTHGQRIQSVEYYFGSDPGQGKATALTISASDTLNQVFSIPISALPEGFNNVSVRVQDSIGIWSLTQTKIFYKMPLLTNSGAMPKVKQMEYFFDQDPGFGNGTPLSFTNLGDTVYQVFSIPVSSIGAGFHNLCVRVQDSSGIWSLTQSKVFYVMPQIATSGAMPKVKDMEYFFDDDPGFGNGTPLTFTQMADTVYQVFSVPVNSLSEGFHDLSVRVKDSIGVWSLTMSKVFYVMPQTSITGATPKIKNVEYFFDHDPGYGNGIPLSFASFGDSAYQVFSVPINTLGEGFHNLAVRVQDSLGLWSLVQSKVFYVMNPVNALPSVKITALEYYFDHDPSVGLANPLSVSLNDTINQAFSLSMNALDSGLHYLGIRAMDSLGVWSLIMVDTFRVLGCESPVANFTCDTSVCIGDTLFLTNLTTNTDQYISYEWDFENDGVIDATSVNDTFFVYPQAGSYQLKLRATNSSIFSFGCVDTLTKQVVVNDLPSTALTVYGSGNICPGSTVSIGVSSALGNTYQWFKDNSVLPNTNTAVYNASSNGSYSVEVTNFNGCVDTSSEAIISMYSIPVANITTSGPLSFCSNDSVTLSASTGMNLSYQWYKNGVALSSDTVQSITVNTPGAYKVQISNADGCVNESTPEIVTVNPLPFVNLIALSNTVFCDGDSVILQTNYGSNYQYEWYRDGILSSNDTSYQIEVDSTSQVYVHLTDQNGCSATSSNISITVNEIPSSDFTIDSLLCTNDTILLTYGGTASSSAFYNWDFDGATILSGSGQGPYEVKWITAGAKSISLQVNENSCPSSVTNSQVYLNSVVANIVSANTNVCQGDSIIISANQGPHFNYQWYQGGVQMNGKVEDAVRIFTTGNYQVEITDTMLGCSQLSNHIIANVFSTDFNLDFSGSATSFSQPPFDVSFTNSTPNLSNYLFEWSFGDGQTSNFYQPMHSYAYNGDYTVQLYAEDASTGCRDTLIKTDYISCTGGANNPCNIIAAINPPGPITICNGDSVELSASSGSGYNYQWIFNGLVIPGADSIVFWAKQAGSYRVVITDTICSQTSPAFVLSHYPSIPPQIAVVGSIQPCTDDSLELFLPTSYILYSWSTGDTTTNTFVKQTGYYTVAVQDHYGCNMQSAPYAVNASFLLPPEVCIVGVDSANHNRLIYERPSNALIDSIYIYREGIIAGSYDLIGKKAYGDPGIFSDTNSNPAVRAYRYRLAAKDTCGAITLMSTLHKTIHLTINAGLNGSWNLIWDGYIGFPFGSYRIYRGTSTTNMSLLTQLPSTSTSYTDLNPPTGTVYYQIEVVKVDGCYPDSSYSKAQTNYNTSRSNVANNAMIVPVYLTADFSANVLTGQWPIQVEFTDLSTGNPTSWHWDFGDGNTSVEQNPKHTYNNTGVYTVTLQICNQGVCDTTTKVGYINVSPNGIVEIDVDISAKLYPNPNDGTFVLDLQSKQRQDVHLSVFNNQGQMVYQESFVADQSQKKKVDLSAFAKGIYYVRLSTNQSLIFTEKVIVN